MKKKRSKRVTMPTLSRATYRIEWWKSEKDGGYYAAAVCVENGEETWRQSEGLVHRIDMMRVIDGLFRGLWPIRKVNR